MPQNHPTKPLKILMYAYLEHIELSYFHVDISFSRSVIFYRGATLSHSFASHDRLLAVFSVLTFSKSVNLSYRQLSTFQRNHRVLALLRSKFTSHPLHNFGRNKRVLIIVILAFLPNRICRQIKMPCLLFLIRVVHPGESICY